MNSFDEQLDPPDAAIPARTWTCECGAQIERFRGDGDKTCLRCGAEYNAFGQRLRDDWRGNPSTWDGDIDDLTGFEIQHAGDDY